jgi:mitochondrial cardiolipin hydrolase
MTPRSCIKNLVITLLAGCLCLPSIAWKKPPENNARSSREVYFSPNGHIRSRIIEEINNTKNSIDIAVYHITSYGIESALKKALKRGVKIRVIADQGESEDIHSVVNLLKESGFAVKLVKGKGKNGLMHNKFAVFDHQLLLTGSYNWTETAEHYNYENTLLLKDKPLVKAYEKEFDLLWSNA